MKIVTNLNFDGRCREAFERYAEILGGTLKAMIPFADMPDAGVAVAEDWKAKIAHAWLDVGDQSMMGCDAPPRYQEAMGGFSVCVTLPDAGEARRVFDALCEGGQMSMPMMATSWSPAFGMLRDRFGTPWMIGAAGPAAA